MKGKSRIWLLVGLGVLLVGLALALTLGRGEGGWTANTRPPEVGQTLQPATEEGGELFG